MEIDSRWTGSTEKITEVPAALLGLLSWRKSAAGASVIFSVEPVQRLSISTPSSVFVVTVGAVGDRACTVEQMFLQMK